jgi:predicted GNAT family acetyltransferase
MAEQSTGAPVVTDNAAESRFEVHVDGQRAGLIKYQRNGDELSILHTEVDEKFQGMGLAGILARAALDQARARGESVLPYCPYVRSWIGKHPDYVDLVPADRRPAFGL